METETRIKILKNFYFYLVSFVTLMMMAFTVSDLISILLKTYVFPKADNFSYVSKTPGCDPQALAYDKKIEALPVEECVKLEAAQEEENQKMRTANNQSNMIRDLSMIVVALPLFILHWRVARRKED